MATINEKMAREIAANDGTYPGDPQCFAVFKYWNSEFHKECFACAYDGRDFTRYAKLYDITEFLFAQDREWAETIARTYKVARES